MKDSQLVETELKQTLDVLYREGANEEPPEALDAEILALASAHLASPKPEIAVRRGIRRFPYAISSAASLLLLVGLVLTNPQQVFFNTDTVLPEADMLMVPVAEEGMVRTEMNANARTGVSSAPEVFSASPTTTDATAAAQAETTAILKSSAMKSVMEPLALRPDGLADTDDIDLLLASLEDTLAGGGRQQTLQLIEAFIARDYELTAQQQVRFELLQSQLAD
ncbi:hypothetical protein [Shewanella litorisediminis]|uniref:Anti-sigma factor n=1 Tax=Shewanella litorisediminis TaxID=1173586 RepID=A0ABX7G651_9GAMM|nr:hypothetical protein [Shewanella litorisediminis]MCL2917689.1 hypothetical protein [Shewanella litorisediminis]QRH02809.1 hypothetical protein JQC75_05190 [Shewanella litorisediminis]